MYMQSVSLACAGKLREERGRREGRKEGRREGGREEGKVDMYVNRQTHRQTDRQAHEHSERLKTPLSLILPVPPLCHMFIAAPEEPSDWWVQPSVRSVSQFLG